MQHHILPVSPATVHWGYFSKRVAPSLTLRSGDRATIETLTHHANDDHERMIAGDPGAESVFHWTREHKAVSRRGAGPTDGPFRLGSGEGIGVHLLTGPVVIDGAEPGDILEVRILDVLPRPSCHACHRPLLRLERGGLLGLPVSRPDRRTEAPGSRHHL
jgi:acetamidase/formamidase